MQPVVPREDLRPLLAVLLVPIFIALPQLLGFLQVDPIFTAGSIGIGGKPGIVVGRPYIDPNAGFQTQALGHLSAMQWLAGKVPWWNHFTGIGLPLAAEYQPASFFPLTFLTLLPNGMAWLHVVLQCFAGAGTFLALRALGSGQRASVVGGILFALNGTSVWLPFGPGSVAPWLPWFVYGIERARAASELGLRAGWRILALAMAMSLLAGFPETAYIDGLLCLVWACVRGFTLPRSRRLRFAARIAGGGTVGILLAAPQLLPFFEYLGHAHVGGHDDMAHMALPGLSAIGSLVAPYVFGPMFAYHDAWNFLLHFWGTIGGYVTIALVATAVYGFLVRRDALAWALAAWVLLALGKTFLIEPAVMLWNLVPGIKIAAFARYAQPSWAFALVVLASRALEDTPRERVRTARIVAAALGIGAWAWAAWVLGGFTKELGASRGLANSAIAAMAWAALTLATVIAWLGGSKDGRRHQWLAGVLVLDAALMAFVPSLSAPRSTGIDRAATGFLRANLGLHRFFTLGPIAPNYGAFFGIASINHNYLPVANRWVRELQGRIDTAHDDVVVFDGQRHTAPAAAREHMDELRRLSVRYVVAPAGMDPYTGRDDVKVAYRDPALTIFELPSPAPYFESNPACRLTATERDVVQAECDQPSTLVRKELYFPGWSAFARGSEMAVQPYEDLFQSVSVPAGRSTIEFRYSPAHAGIAWALMGAAMLVLLASAIPGRRPDRLAAAGAR